MGLPRLPALIDRGRSGEIGDRDIKHVKALGSGLSALALVVAALFAVGGPAPDKLRPAPLRDSFGDGAAEAELGPADPGPIEWMYGQRAGAHGVVSTKDYERALAAARDLEQLTARLAPELSEAEWTSMGPVNFGGRVSEVAVDPTTRNTVYAATASGGLWKSTDAGITWSYSWPSDLTQAMGALAIGSDGVIYAGTGEPNPGGGSITFGGTGMYRSTDDGATWERVGLKTSGAFGRIAVDPTNPERVFAAASGNLFVPGGKRGLYRSTDGGDTWQRVLKGINRTTGAIDVAVDPANPDNLLAAMWDHVRYPSHRVYAGPGSAVYRSADGGDTWERVTLAGAPAPEEVGRIGVAFAPSDPKRAYAVIANKLDGTAVGLWRSNDGGKSWARTSASPGSLSQSTYGWWFGKVWVDPRDANHLYVAGLELVESHDGGNTFAPQSNYLAIALTGVNQIPVHPDQHGMEWDPHVPGRVYLGNDGGMYRSDANGAPGTWAAGVLQGWTQHYSVDVSEQNPNRVVSGLQDNGCKANYVAGNIARPDTWHHYSLCGDGLQTLIDYSDDGIVYGCSQYGSCNRGSGGGVAVQFFGGTTSQRRGWWVPVQFDPNDPKVLYYGGNILNRSTDGGATFKAISPDLTRDEPQLDPNPGYRIYNTITTVAPAKSDGKVIYVGTDDGLLWRTTDGGATWTKLTDRPDEWVTRVAVDPTDADAAYATFSGYRAGDNSPKVIRTTDGGSTWTDITGNLPPAPVNDVIVIGAKLAVGTDVGVYLTEDGGKTWLEVGSSLPAVPVLDIRYHEGTNSITAATFGHGIQRVTLP